MPSMTLLSNLPYEYTSTTQFLGRSRNSGHFNAVNAISVSKDGQFLATGDDDGLLIVSLAQSTERPLAHALFGQLLARSAGLR